MEVQETTTKPGKSNRFCFCAFISTFILLAILIILVSAVLHKIHSQGPTPSSFIPSRGATVNERFPGYFRTKKQQENFEKENRFVHTGCCNSDPHYVSPTYWVDSEDVNRTIAQFDGHQQYFLQESCIQIANCLSCRCQTLPYLVTAVYVVAVDSYDVGWFDLGSCCKCINS
ncbi:hypothetical protein LOTGIDRAFT_236213 [Lottia gigantea]|uniref:Uncharacterized protein n=1 Tax=Lottia gigantea TaxID=225164 RepID=V4B7G7_LOTGI|nr:hypothetical protein LOTGIDRAFT_236213 [Lottia gigantea]ESO84539.1 hypothetical protein LOTGIDRAFT_236213 [Lottia gigantea]